MTHSVQFTAHTSCANSTIAAYVMELSVLGGAVLETFTLGSGAAVTAGVTHNPPVAPGTLPIIDIDENVITQDLRLTFVSYTTACGLATVGEFTDVRQASGQTPALFLSGCERHRNFKYMPLESPGISMWPHSPAGNPKIFIGQDGKLYAYGSNYIGTFGYGINVQQSNIRYLNGMYGAQRGGLLPLPNILFHYPNMTFCKVQHVSSYVVALSDDGELITYGGGENQSTATGNYQPVRALPNTPVVLGDSFIPNSIPHPTGGKWLWFELINFSSSTQISITAYGDDGKWYAWGYGATGPRHLGITANDGTTSDETYTPTEVAFKLGGPPRAPNFNDPFVYSKRLWQNRTNVWGVWMPAADSNAVYKVTRGGSTPIYEWRLPTGVNAVQFHEMNQAGLYILGDDGKMYWGHEFTQGSGLSGANTAPLAGLQAGNYPQPTELPGNLTNGVKLIKFSLYEFVGIALGDDGKMYVWTHNTGMTELPLPRNDGNVVDFWADDDLNSVWKYANGDIRVIGRVNSNWIDNDDYQFDAGNRYNPDTLMTLLGYDDTWAYPTSNAPLPPYLPVDCQFGRGLDS